MSAGASISPKIVREAVSTNLSDDDIEGSISDALDFYDLWLVNQNLAVRVQIKIKKYLAAHFVALKDPSTRIDKEKIGDAEITYTKIGHDDSYMGLKSTRWGQMAIDWDPTGILSTVGSKPPKWYAL